MSGEGIQQGKFLDLFSYKISNTTGTRSRKENATDVSDVKAAFAEPPPSQKHFAPLSKLH